MPNSEQVTLSVEDFGPIAKATVELRPFTVFVGASNTGKSYLAILLYTLQRFFGAGSGVTPISPARLHDSSNFRSQMTDEQGVAAHQWLQQARDQLAHRGSPIDVVLPDEIANSVRPILQGVRESALLFDAQAKRCFGVAESGDLVRQPAGKCARVVLRREVHDGGAAEIGYDFAIKRTGTQLKPSIPEDVPLRVKVTSDIDLWRLEQRLSMRFPETFHVDLADSVVPSIVGAIGNPVHYLPADRAGVMRAHKVVVSSLVRRASRAGLEPESPLPVLSGVLADFLEGLIELDDRKQTTSRQLAKRLETDILGGSVSISQSTVGYPSFHYRPENWQDDLPLMNTSSMVSELAPVVLYLRHVVQPGDVLIIEEPESHLHPAMQVSFTRYLAGVVKAGIRVIVTTHSEWVLEALANLVQLSEVPEARRSKISGGPALKPEEVGAWSFERQEWPQGSVVREIPLDTVRGTFPAGFGDITEQLYNDWASITNLAQRTETKST